MMIFAGNYFSWLEELESFNAKGCVLQMGHIFIHVLGFGIIVSWF